MGGQFGGVGGRLLLLLPQQEGRSGWQLQQQCSGKWAIHSSPFQDGRTETVSEKRPLLSIAWGGYGRHRSSLPINP